MTWYAVVWSVTADGAKEVTLGPFDEVSDAKRVGQEYRAENDDPSAVSELRLCEVVFSEKVDALEHHRRMAELLRGDRDALRIRFREQPQIVDRLRLEYDAIERALRQSLEQIKVLLGRPSFVGSVRDDGIVYE